MWNNLYFCAAFIFPNVCEGNLKIFVLLIFIRIDVTSGFKVGRMIYKSEFLPPNTLSLLPLILLVTIQFPSLLGILAWQPSAPLCNMAFAPWVCKDVGMGVFLSRGVMLSAFQSTEQKLQVQNAPELLRKFWFFL